VCVCVCACVCVLQLHRLKRAMAFYETALSLRPNNAHTLTCIAVTHHLAGRLEVCNHESGEAS
jgi:hypothetical protein